MELLRSPRTHVHVDEEARTVAGRPAPRSLWLRGAAFVVLGIGLPALVLGTGDRPSWITIPVLLVTAVTAAWLAAGLQQGWEIDERGVRAGTGRRRPHHLDWAELGGLKLEETDDGASLVAVTRDGRPTGIGAAGEPDELRRALRAAEDLGLVPVHVTVDPGTGPRPDR